MTPIAHHRFHQRRRERRAAVPAPPARSALTGCPWHDVKSMLRDVGLRPTRQRMALGWILFGKGDRHITAEMLYEEATKAKVPVSLATVYNTLHQFTDVGLLRQVAVDGSKTYFDTNVSQHHHFFVEGENASARHPRRRRRGRQDADTARGLRGRAYRRGGSAAPQGTLSGSSTATVQGGTRPSGQAWPLSRGFTSFPARSKWFAAPARLFHLLVRIDAPQLFLHNPAVEAWLRRGDTSFRCSA